MNELLLGIDIGTASSKAVLVQPDGQVVALASRDHAVSMPRPGWVEHDAETIWWSDVVSLCRELLAPVADGRISGVCFSGIGPCVVPCDTRDTPLRPAILYGVDTRASAEVDELTELLGADQILRRCGSSLSSQALGPKLAWLRNNEPAVWTATERWHMASSFVVARLTGEWILDHHSASQCDPLYDLVQCGWNYDWAELVAPGLSLPPLAWPGEVVGRVRSASAEATGIPAGTPVVAGTIDSWAEAVSAGVRKPGELMLQYGSTVFLVLGTDRLAPHPTFWTTRGVDPGSLTIAAGLATGGSLASWVREIVGRPSYETLLAEAALVHPGAEGLLILPYFAGERTPILDPHARGTITGLSLRHDRAHIFRAALEGVAFAIRHNLETMLANDTPELAVAVGGGTTNDLWLQIVSDVTGLTQTVPAVTVGASYGDALLAAEGVGLTPALSSWAQPAEVTSPNSENDEVYYHLYSLYRDLYPATREIQHALSDLELPSSTLAMRPPPSGRGDVARSAGDERTSEEAASVT